MQSRLRGLLTQRRILTQTTASIERSQWLSPEGWQTLQLNSLRQLALDAQRRVPYYRDLYDRLDIDPARWTSLADLNLIPELGKDDVIAAGASLLAEGGPWLRFKGSTSGTTGRAMLKLASGCDSPSIFGY